MTETKSDSKAADELPPVQQSKLVTQHNPFAKTIELAKYYALKHPYKIVQLAGVSALAYDDFRQMIMDSNEYSDDADEYDEDDLSELCEKMFG